MFAQLARWLSPSKSLAQAHAIYVALVGQARQPFFYTHLQVADTLDGRFDLIALHLFAFSHAMQSHRELNRHLLEIMIQDMDQSLREMGVGDMSIGKKVEKMAYALNGRMQTYEETLSDDDALARAISRNLYRQADTIHPHAMPMVRYVRESIAHLVAQPPQEIQCAQLNWANPQEPT